MNQKKLMSILLSILPGGFEIVRSRLEVPSSLLPSRSQAEMAIALFEYCKQKKIIQELEDEIKIIQQGSLNTGVMLHSQIRELECESQQLTVSKCLEQRPRSEIRLNIEATGQGWKVRVEGLESRQVAGPIEDEVFRNALLALEKSVQTALPCEENGTYLSKAASFATELVNNACVAGEKLMAVFGEDGQERLVECIRAARGTDIVPLLRVCVHGIHTTQTDLALSMPWELLWLSGPDGGFPVKKGELDIVREASLKGSNEAPPYHEALRVLVHIAAPESEERHRGWSDLEWEEESYRLTRTMQDVVEDAVAFTDMGTLDDLIEAVGKLKPNVIHFSGHGRSQELLFENEDCGPVWIPTETLLNRLKALTERGWSGLPTLFYLASCHGTRTSHDNFRAKEGEPVLKNEDASPLDSDSSLVPASVGTKQVTDLPVPKLDKHISTAASLHRAGCKAVIGYFGPVGDRLSTCAESVFYRHLATGGLITGAVRRARSRMGEALKFDGGFRRYPLGWAQLALYMRGNDGAMVERALHSLNTRSLDESLHRDLCSKAELSLEGNAGFIGRRRSLARLRKLHRIDGIRLLVLQGMAGVGKTALALALLQRLRIAYERILILNAHEVSRTTDPATTFWNAILRHIEANAPKLFARVKEVLSGQVLDVIEQVPLVLRALSFQEPLVLYFDGLESLVVISKHTARWSCPRFARWWTTITRYAHRGGPLTLIATSRYAWDNLPSTSLFSVPLLGPGELLRMANWCDALRAVPRTTRQQIVEHLGGHTRALIFLEGLLQDSLDPQMLPALDNMPTQLILATYDKLCKDLALEPLCEQVQDSTLRLLGELQALRQPIELSAIDLLGNDSLTLRRFGLLTRFSNQLWGLHRVVADFVGSFLPEPSPETHQHLGRWYAVVYQSNKVLLNGREAVYHLLVAQLPDEAALVGEEMSLCYWRALQYQQALKVLTDVLTANPSKELRGKLLTRRGYIYDDMGQYKLARIDFEVAMVLLKDLDGTQSWYAESLSGLADSQVRMGEYEEAVGAYRESLRIIEQTHGTKFHSTYAASLAGLATAQGRMGKYEEAVDAYREALSIQATVYRTDEHPESLSVRTNLAKYLAQSGQLQLAVQEMERAIGIARRKKLGSYYVGNISFIMAQVLIDSDPSHALQMAKLAQAELSSILSPSHPQLQKVKQVITILSD